MDLADKMCLIVYAPLFDKKRFPGWRYNRGGIVRDGRVLPQTEWTVGYVRDLLQWARLREHRPGAPYYLFGHSAGGQFLSRVAAFGLPADARRIVIANPSTYVLPSLDEDAPYGLGNAFDKLSGEKQLREYLKLPLTVYLGDEDTGDKDLTQNGPAMRQGENRLERGENFFELGRSVAKENGWVFGWRLVKARSVGHSARKMLSAAMSAVGGEPKLVMPSPNPTGRRGAMDTGCFIPRPRSSVQQSRTRTIGTADGDCSG